jgi:hypothetical protein
VGGEGARALRGGRGPRCLRRRRGRARALRDLPPWPPTPSSMGAAVRCGRRPGEMGLCLGGQGIKLCGRKSEMQLQPRAQGALGGGLRR